MAKTDRSVALEESQNQALEYLATKRMASVSFLIRTAVQDFLERNRDDLPASFFGNGANHEQQCTLAKMSDAAIETMSREECLEMAQKAERELEYARHRLHKTRYYQRVRGLEYEIEYWRDLAQEKNTG